MSGLNSLLPNEPEVRDAFLWATVTQAYPMRIRLDGATTALLPDTFTNLVGPLPVGTSVWVQIRDRQALILATGSRADGRFSGEVTTGAIGTAPPGWLSCWGQAVSRTDYAGLFAAIGTAYGAGNGTTTFNVPNMIGRVPVGPTGAYAPMNGLGKTGGAFDVTLNTNQMPVHTHIQNAHQHTHDQSGGGSLGYSGDGSTVAYGASFGNTRLNTGIMTATATAVNQNAGGGASHTNVQPFTTLNFFIHI